MILNRLQLLFAVAIVMLAMALVSCVEIPDKAPDPPVLNAEFRFISVLPDGVTPPATVGIADGPNFTSYKSYSIGTNINPSSYYTFLSGSKRIVYSALDTFRITFETDQRATVAFFQTRAGAFDAIKLPYRNTFAANGIVDSALVRFVNLVQKAQSTINVYRSDSTQDVAVAASASLAYGTSGAAIKIAKGKTYNFFFTDSSNTNRVFKDSIAVVGATRKVYTVFVYDAYDTTGTTVALKTAKVKVKVLEEL